MSRKSGNSAARRRTFLLDRSKTRPQRFSVLHPEIVSSAASLRDSVSHATRESLWISYARDLTESLLRSLSWPPAPLGSAVLLHAANVESLPALTTCFQRVAFSADGGFLPAEELAEALGAENRADLFIGGSIDAASRTITFWRASLEPLTIPFSAFEPSGDGTEPDFTRLSVTDSGQTVRLGEYEAAVDAILYEFDPDYRRRIHKQRLKSERSFGASLRRLRKQRGLKREDFAPLAGKTVARIEQNQVRRLHPRTLSILAERLGVPAGEIGSF